MNPLKNVRHEAFAQARARGETADAAYAAAGYKRHDGNAARLSGNERILKRIQAIQAENDELSKLSRQQALAFLADIVRTPIGKVTADSPLCQEHTTDVAQELVMRTKVKMPGKIEALRLMGQWCGWETGNQAETKTADVVSQLLSHVIK